MLYEGELRRIALPGEEKIPYYEAESLSSYWEEMHRIAYSPLLVTAVAYAPGNGTRYNILLVPKKVCHRVGDSWAGSSDDKAEDWVWVALDRGKSYIFDKTVFKHPSYIQEKFGLLVGDAIEIACFLMDVFGYWDKEKSDEFRRVCYAKIMK